MSPSLSSCSGLKYLIQAEYLLFRSDYLYAVLASLNQAGSPKISLDSFPPVQVDSKLAELVLFWLRQDIPCFQDVN